MRSAPYSSILQITCHMHPTPKYLEITCHLTPAPTYWRSHAICSLLQHIGDHMSSAPYSSQLKIIRHLSAAPTYWRSHTILPPAPTHWRSHAICPLLQHVSVLDFPGTSPPYSDTEGINVLHTVYSGRNGISAPSRKNVFFGIDIT